MKKNLSNLTVRVGLFVVILCLGTIVALMLDETEGLALADLSNRPLQTLIKAEPSDTLYTAGMDATTASNIYRSEDSGRTWQAINFAPSVTINALAVHPLNESVLYAGTVGGPINDTNNLWRSEDGGQSWQKFFVSLPDQVEGDVPAVTALAITSNRPNVLYVGTDGQGIYRFEVGPQGDGYRLADKTLLNYAHVKSIAPGRDEQIYVLAGEGIFVTDGINWQKLKTVPETVLSLAVDPNNNKILYAGGASSGVFRSEDGGQTWQNMNEGLGLVPGAALRVTALAVDEQDSTHVVAATAYGLGKRIAAWGVYESRQAGEGWKKLGDTEDVVTALKVDNGVVYATTAKGLKRYGKAGESPSLIPGLRSLAHPSGVQILVLTLSVSLGGLALLAGPKTFHRSL